MQINDMDPATLRRLAGLRPEGAKVLSLYVNLDPSEFATPASRSTVINSVLDEAEKKISELELERPARVALEADLDRARKFFANGGFSAKGAHALALFAASPIELFEAARLPRPVDAGAVIHDTPWIEPLTKLTRRERLSVVLVNRRSARIFGGAAGRLQELAGFSDDVHGWHDQGGWSQARYQRGIEKEISDHLRRAADALFARWRIEPFDLLIVGGAEELLPHFEEHLHPCLRERLAGRIDVDVEHAGVDDVGRAVAARIEEHERAREGAALERLKTGLGQGARAAAGLDAVRAALEERRVEVLLYEEGFAAPDVVESMLEAAVMQAADTLPVRHHADLGPLGGVGAVLRF